MNIMLAIIVGFLFGFVLQKAGAASPAKIIGMLRLTDLHLMKAILLGIGISSLLLFTLLSAGIISGNHLSIKTSYMGVIAGGAILGLGWAMAGFCPGTSLVAAGAGRKDALFFITGGLVGAGIFTLSYGSIQNSWLFDDLGGKATLATTGVEKYSVMLPSLPALWVAGAIAAVFIIIAVLLPASTASSENA
ncbi:DUF6691 family protein [Spongorhabdus nitratireducens]